MTVNDNSEWLSQVRRGVLEFAVLKLILRTPTYGYEIVNSLANEPVLAAAEGTVYPLLRRLRKDKLLATKWVPSEAGPPRQYYEITDDGRKHLRELTRDWAKLANAIERLHENGVL